MTTVFRYLKPFWTILVYFGISLFLQACYLVLGINNAIITNVMLVFASLLATGYVVYKFKDELKNKFEDFKKNIKTYSKRAFANWGLGFVCMFIANLILVSLLNGLAPNEEANRSMMDSLFFFTVIYSILLAPVAEELLFRSNFKDIFKNKKMFVFSTALLFGAMHVIGQSKTFVDFLYIVPYMCLGYAFSKTYVETGNVYSCIMIHMFHNLLSVLIIVLNI